VVAAVAIAAVLLLGMVAAAGYAARALPSGARVPLHAGMPEHSVWLAKPVGLGAWLGVGAASFAAFAALTLSSIAANWEQSTRFVLLPGVMLVVLAAEASAIIVAQRSAASPEPSTTSPELSTASQPPENLTDTPVDAGKSNLIAIGY